MIKFLFKGLIRDRSRSLFPLIVVVLGVMLTVFLYSWMEGTENEMISSNAFFDTGHVKIMSRAYAEEIDQIPNDLAYIGVDALMDDLKNTHPGMVWTPRIRFGGLLDIPDENNETRSQGPVAGLAIDLFSQSSPEREILNLEDAMVRGKFPENPGEILVSDLFAKKLGVKPGETATLISTTMYGSFATYNFKVTGTIRFGVSAMDRGAMIADVSDVQYALDMVDAAGEILGFLPDYVYRDDSAGEIARDFNAAYEDPEDAFSPVMLSLREQSGLAEMLDMYDYFSGILLAIFVSVMSLVLWNAGLMGSLRRYGEIGLRLAIGEAKGHVYRSMIIESLIIGFVGSLIGTGIGVAVSYYLQVKGIDISSMMKNASMLISDVIRAKVTPVSYLIGFIPGLLATFVGTTISGIGIYKRQTSQLAKELET